MKNTLLTQPISGEEGLKKYRENCYDIIFLDLGLPDIHGLEILEEIKSSNPDIPVVIVTAYGKSGSKATMRLNADKYIDKPFDEEDIIKAIDSVLASKNRALSDNSPKIPIDPK